MVVKRIWMAAALAIVLGGPLMAAPVKYEFGARKDAATLAPAPHGSYAKGCLAGGQRLSETGPSWQAMRLSRNRNWGHPAVVSFIARLGSAAQSVGWPGILVGDISQPRGGPMTSGHRSHQIGLDADIWMRPGYDRELSRQEREQVGSFTVVRANKRGVNDNWTPGHQGVLRAAASDPAVARIFVNAAIKQQLCKDVAADDRDWLRKIRPWWGHDAHFHVRLSCPQGATNCINQAAPPPGDGCDETLAWWTSQEALNPKPDPNAPKKPRRKELTLADLPQACEAVLDAK